MLQILLQRPCEYRTRTRMPSFTSATGATCHSDIAIRAHTTHYKRQTYKKNVKRNCFEFRKIIFKHPVLFAATITVKNAICICNKRRTTVHPLSQRVSQSVRRAAYDHILWINFDHKNKFKSSKYAATSINVCAVDLYEYCVPTGNNLQLISF